MVCIWRNLKITRIKSLFHCVHNSNVSSTIKKFNLLTAAHSKKHKSLKLKSGESKYYAYTLKKISMSWHNDFFFLNVCTIGKVRTNQKRLTKALGGKYDESFGKNKRWNVTIPHWNNINWEKGQNQQLSRVGKLWWRSK